MYRSYNISVEYGFDYSKTKDSIVRRVRGLGFDDVIEIIKKGKILDEIDHFNKKKYPNQRIFIVRIENKIYAVPYVVDKIRKVKFLKTIYPSRMLKKKYLKQI